FSRFVPPDALIAPTALSCSNKKLWRKCHFIVSTETSWSGPFLAAVVASWRPVIARIRSQISFADLSPRGGTTLNIDIQSSMRDEKIFRSPLKQLPRQVIQCGTADLMVLVTTKD